MEKQPKVTIIEPVHRHADNSELAVATKLRVAAYARVSTEQDEQQNSYEAQVDYYTRYIQSNPEWEFVSVFSDEGISGTNTKNREGFNRMIDMALAGGIDLILTKSISRFARNTVDTLQTVRKLKAIGVEVIFEKENLHTLDPKCEMILTIFSSLAQEESRSMSENIRWGHRKNMADGKVTLPYSSFLGYRKGKDGRPEIVEEEASVIRKIYSMFLDGYTINDIARYLTGQSIPTPRGKQKWSVSTIRSILGNEKYVGNALLQKTYTVDYLTKEKRKNSGELPQYLIEYSHDPIIDPDTFEQVQEKLKTQASYRQKIRGNSPLSNSIICGVCGGFYGHKVWHNHSNTERYDVWYCNSKYNGDIKCKSPVLREEEVKDAFGAVLRQLGKESGRYTEMLWRKLVENVTVYADRKLEFHFKSGETICHQL